ncbi:MAG: methyltransferase domain-containing protein [Acidimicrobiia bacterium]|nr:methyltransferase domain-containing protein [Acidimicrobiia bacterium]
MTDAVEERSAPFDPEAHPRKLNLGCGWDVRNGYLNVDLHEVHQPDLVADITDLSMLPSGFYEEIVAQDVLEHLRREDALPALREWARLLQPGGRLFLRVPNLIGLLGLLAERTTIESQRELVQCLFGTQAYNGDYHQNGYTELLLRQTLFEAGFGDPEFTSKDDWLFDVVAVRTDSPKEPTIEDCRFMAVGSASSSGPAAAEPLSAVHDALARAESVADLGPGFVTGTRLTAPKKALLRVLRLVTHRQEQHNAAVVDAVRALAERVERGR